MIFINFIFNILLLISKNWVLGTEVVDQIDTWPVPVESSVKFNIMKEYTRRSELLVRVVDDDEKVLSQKSLKVMKKIYVDQSTDYFIIKKERSYYGTAKFSVTMTFYRKCHGHFLSMDWVEKDEKGVASPEPLYKEKISLTKDWSIDIKVQVLEYDQTKTTYVDDPRYFQSGKRVKVSCSAFDGLPPAQVFVKESVTKRFRDVSYDESLNLWVGYLTLDVDDHNRTLSCQVRGDPNQNQSYHIMVNHPTTSVKLFPDHNGFVKNGSTILCQPFDGYPIPVMKWVFVSARNHSNPSSLYEINNDELIILPQVAAGTKMEFNCSATYTNPLDDQTITVTRTFDLIVGEKPDNIKVSLNHLGLSKTSQIYATLNMAAIGAGVAMIVIMVIVMTVMIMLCRSKPKPSRCASNQQQGSPKYAGSLLAGSKSALRNQVKGQNGSSTALMSVDSSTTANTDQNELNYDDMPRGRRPIKVVDDPVIYSTIVGTMQPKSRPSLDLGPIDRV